MVLVFFSDLSWNIHINETIKKASLRLLFLGFNLREPRFLALISGSFPLVVLDHLWTIRSFTTVCLLYLIQEVERVQKRAMPIICPGYSHHEALDIINFKELSTQHDEMTKITAFISYYLCRMKQIFVKARETFQHATVQNRSF